MVTLWAALVKVFPTFIFFLLSCWFFSASRCNVTYKYKWSHSARLISFMILHVSSSSNTATAMRLFSYLMLFGALVLITNLKDAECFSIGARSEIESRELVDASVDSSERPTTVGSIVAAKPSVIDTSTEAVTVGKLVAELDLSLEVKEGVAAGRNVDLIRTVTDASMMTTSTTSTTTTTDSPDVPDFSSEVKVSPAKPIVEQQSNETTDDMKTVALPIIKEVASKQDELDTSSREATPIIKQKQQVRVRQGVVARQRGVVQSTAATIPLRVHKAEQRSQLTEEVLQKVKDEVTRQISLKKAPILNRLQVARGGRQPSKVVPDARIVDSSPETIAQPAPAQPPRRVVVKIRPARPIVTTRGTVPPTTVLRKVNIKRISRPANASTATSSSINAIRPEARSILQNPLGLQVVEVKRPVVNQPAVQSPAVNVKPVQATVNVSQAPFVITKSSERDDISVEVPISPAIIQSSINTVMSISTEKPVVQPPSVPVQQAVPIQPATAIPVVHIDRDSRERVDVSLEVRDQKVVVVPQLATPAPTVAAIPPALVPVRSIEVDLSKEIDRPGDVSLELVGPITEKPAVQQSPMPVQQAVPIQPSTAIPVVHIDRDSRERGDVSLEVRDQKVVVVPQVPQVAVQQTPTVATNAPALVPVRSIEVDLSTETDRPGDVSLELVGPNTFQQVAQNVTQFETLPAPPQIAIAVVDNSREIEGAGGFSLEIANPSINLEQVAQNSTLIVETPVVPHVAEVDISRETDRRDDDISLEVQHVMQANVSNTPAVIHSVPVAQQVPIVQVDLSREIDTPDLSAEIQRGSVVQQAVPGPVAVGASNATQFTVIDIDFSNETDRTDDVSIEIHGGLFLQQGTQQNHTASVSIQQAPTVVVVGNQNRNLTAVHLIRSSVERLDASSERNDRILKHIPDSIEDVSLEAARPVVPVPQAAFPTLQGPIVSRHSDERVDTSIETVDGVVFQQGPLPGQQGVLPEISIRHSIEVDFPDVSVEDNNRHIIGVAQNAQLPNQQTIVVTQSQERPDFSLENDDDDDVIIVPLNASMPTQQTTTILVKESEELDDVSLEVNNPVVGVPNATQQGILVRQQSEEQGDFSAEDGVVGVPVQQGPIVPTVSLDGRLVDDDDDAFSAEVKDVSNENVPPAGVATQTPNSSGQQMTFLEDGGDGSFEVVQVVVDTSNNAPDGIEVISEVEVDKDKDELFEKILNAIDHHDLTDQEKEIILKAIIAKRNLTISDDKPIDFRTVIASALQRMQSSRSGSTQITTSFGLQMLVAGLLFWIAL